MTIDSADISENSSQSALAARREARRKRILENAENRLRKLTGVEQKSHVLIEDFKPIKYDEPITDIPDVDHTRPINNMHPNLMMTSINQSSRSETLENGLGKWKYNQLNTAIGISLLANFFILLSTMIYDETEMNIVCNMIFLPFLGFKCFEYYSLKNNVPEKNIFHLLLMANLKNDLLKRIFIYTQYLTSFMQDLGIYFFIFVCINQLLKVNLIFR